jgi:hypothetical protein
LIFPRKQFVVFITGLLLFAGQLATIVHATEHPFHDNSQICASFISLEHHDATVSSIALTADLSFYADEHGSGHGLLVYTSNLNSNHAREPPLTT